MHHCESGFNPIPVNHNPHAAPPAIGFHGAPPAMVNLNVPPPALSYRRSYAFSVGTQRQFAPPPPPPLYYRHSYQFRVLKENQNNPNFGKRKQLKSTKSTAKLDKPCASSNGTSNQENESNAQLNNTGDAQTKCNEQTPKILPDNGSTVIEVSASGEPLPLVSMDSGLSNSKEKTPMCLVNELARYNKITHQYRLTSEDGQPHKKRFTVTLNLGDEEYTSEEASIKKAQHSAAADAIRSTNYKHPPLKVNRLPQRSSSQVGLGNITPTVELNALAMKRGETPVYEEVIPAVDPSNESGNNVPVAHYTVFRGVASHYANSFGRYPTSANRFLHQMNRPLHYQGRTTYESRPDHPYKVNLVVGERKFVANGLTLQLARHNAAAMALDVLRPLTEDVSNDVYTDPEDMAADIKSPISLIHEIVLKRGNSVEFHVLSEKGPPHMKTFVTQCIVGNIVTEGEGNGKKISKKRAAESMLIELRKLPPISPSTMLKEVPPKAKQSKRKAPPVKKKARNLIKENPDEEPEDVNPISRLIHVSQNHKAKDPQYTLITEAGTPRRREFVIEVCAVNQTAQGVGSTKKHAKRNAAENLLLKMGLSSTTKVVDNSKDIDESQRKPDKTIINVKSTENKIMEQIETSSLPGTSSTQVSTLKEVDEPLVDVLEKKTKHIIRPKEQLLYLSELLNFEMQISDFPKGNHSEYLTLITLATTPPMVCHGQSKTLEESRDQAAVQVLETLTKLGYDTVCPKPKVLTDDAAAAAGINKSDV